MNPVNGPVLVILLAAIVVLAALWRSEAMSARTWRQRAEQLDVPIDLWPVSNVTVTDDWPPAVREWVYAEQFPTHIYHLSPPSGESTWIPLTEAAARDRHPVGKGLGLRVVAGGGE